MSFASRCSAEFRRQVRERGEEFFREGRVRLEPVVGATLRAEVDGSSGNYDVSINWQEADEGFIDAFCTCPAFDDYGPCKHLWATILAADAAGIGPREGSGSLSVLEISPEEWYDEHDEYGDSGDLDDEDSDDTEEASDWPVISFRQHSPAGAKPSGVKGGPGSEPANWRSQLAGVFHAERSLDSGRASLPVLDKSREVWFVLEIGETLRSGALAIHFFQRERKKNGEFGKLKSLNTRADMLDQITSADDRELLRLLLTNDREPEENYRPYGGRYSHYGYYGYAPKTSEVSLSPEAHDTLLPKLCGTGRFVWVTDVSVQDVEEDGRALAWEGDPPWRFQLSITPDDPGQQWRLEGHLVRTEDEAPVPLSSPVLLLASGLVVFEHRLARLEARGIFAWIAAFRRNPAICVPYKDRWELLDRLWQMPSPPQAILPDNLRCEESRIVPQGRLSICSPDRYGRRQLMADVAFQYDHQKIAAKDCRAVLVDAEHERVLVRDRDHESRLLAMLAELGTRVSADGQHDVSIPDNRFSQLVATLVEAGWIVEAEGRKIRKAGQWRMSVTSGIDWFDLEGTCDFDGEAVQLPVLLEALRRGEDYVLLGDGSRGLLPQEWLAKFGPLAEMGSVEEERVRFRPSQAMLLDALLAAHQQVSVDRQFEHLRRKLRSFDGVSPRNEPRGFRGELRNYQKEGLGLLDFLRDFRLGGCLADDMGLGKTVQVLAQLQARRLRSKNGDGSRAPSLAVVPRSLVFNWIEEAGRFTPNLRVLDYTGTLRAGALEQLGQYDLVVTTYGTLCRDIGKFKDIPFDYVILDEAQAIKNAQSQRAKACRLLRAEHRLAATGTPVENHLGELWSLFEFLNPGMLGRSTAFQDLSKRLTGQGEGLSLLRRALAPFILRRTKGQVLRDLPEKTEQTLYCELSGSQRKHYNQLRDYYRASLTERIQKSGMAKAKIHVLEALLRLRQAACHPGLVDKERLGESSVKLDTLIEQLTEVIDEGHKALVFSQFTSFLAVVRRRLDEAKITYEYLDGRTRDRKQRVDRFQSDAACPVFLISLKAGGHGLNLTAADYVFLLDPWWNPAVEAQAVDRTHRIGQTRNVFAYRIIARDTVEEKVLELQKTKRDMAKAVISADGNVLRQLTADDLQMLLS